MKITYDEYIATWQSPEAKADLNRKIALDEQKRYSSRMLGAGANLQSTKLLQTMPLEEYKSLRAYQICQLYQAYQNSKTDKNHKLLSIKPGTTDPEQIRRVVGDKAGYIYNNDILALDDDTISAVNYLSELSGNGYYSYGSQAWEESLTRNNLEKIVDEMVSCKNILVENMNINYEEAIGSKIFRETDIAKRSIGKAQYRYEGDFSQLYNPTQVGRNIFGINDYELSWKQLIERKSKIWAKTGKKLFKFLDRKLHPEEERNNPNRIGNREVKVPKENTKER